MKNEKLLGALLMVFLLGIFALVMILGVHCSAY